MQSTRATPTPTAPEMDWSTPLLVANAPADEPGSPEFPLDDADPASNATTVLSSEPTRRAAAAAICERITESLARGRSLAAVSELFRIGAAEFSELPDGRLPDIVSAATFTASPLPEPEQVIRGVLHRGSKAVYGGPSKAFKSWSLQDMCIAVATGGDWLGFQTTAGNVLYINFELQPFAVHKRLLAICEDRRIAVPEKLHIWHLRGFGRPLSERLPELKRHMKGEGYNLVVPDPVYKTLAGRNENDAGAIAEVCAEIESVAIATGAAVAFGAHFAKGNAASKNAIDRMSGSGVFARDPDAIITATTHEELDAFTVEMTLRNFPQPENFVIRWQYPRMHRDGALDPARLKQPKMGRSPEHDVDEIVNHLEPGLTAKAWAIVCHDEAGITASTFWRLLRQAKRTGLVRKTCNGYELSTTPKVSN